MSDWARDYEICTGNFTWELLAGAEAPAEKE